MGSKVHPYDDHFRYWIPCLHESEIGTRNFGVWSPTPESYAWILTVADPLRISLISGLICGGVNTYHRLWSRPIDQRRDMDWPPRLANSMGAQQLRILNGRHVILGLPTSRLEF
jgi:hypothetical protein